MGDNASSSARWRAIVIRAGVHDCCPAHRGLSLRREHARAVQHPGLGTQRADTRRRAAGSILEPLDNLVVHGVRSLPPHHVMEINGLASVTPTRAVYDI